MEKALKIEKIVKGISGKNVMKRRIEALKNEGFEVTNERIEWNFGCVGATKEHKDGTITVQIRYSTGGRSRNGYGVNACPVVDVQ